MWESRPSLPGASLNTRPDVPPRGTSTTQRPPAANTSHDTAIAVRKHHSACCLYGLCAVRRKREPRAIASGERASAWLRPATARRQGPEESRGRRLGHGPGESPRASQGRSADARGRVVSMLVARSRPYLARCVGRSRQVGVCNRDGLNLVTYGSHPCRPETERARLGAQCRASVRSAGRVRDTWRAHIEPEVPLVRLGRRKLIPVSELQAWLDRHAESVGVGGVGC